MKNYQDDPDRTEYNITMEKHRASSNRWLTMQLVGVIILLALQFSLIGSGLIPSEYMMFYPLIVIAWGTVFVVRSLLHGKRILRYIDFYYTKHE